MNRFMKRMFAVLVIICSVLFMTFVPVNADEQYTEGPLIYTINDGGIIITGYFGNQETVVIPDQIAGIPVFKIAENAFVNTTVKELTLPDTIMSIDNNAIAGDIHVIYQRVDSQSESQTAEPADSEAVHIDEKTENSETSIGDSSEADISGKESDAGEIDLEAEIKKEEHSSSPASSDQSKTSNDADKTENTPNHGSNAGLFVGTGACLAALAGILLFVRKKK